MGICSETICNLDILGIRVLASVFSFWKYRVAQKNGASVFHCKYFENSTTESRGSW